MDVAEAALAAAKRAGLAGNTAITAAGGQAELTVSVPADDARYSRLVAELRAAGLVVASSAPGDVVIPSVAVTVAQAEGTAD